MARGNSTQSKAAASTSSMAAAMSIRSKGSASSSGAASTSGAARSTAKASKSTTKSQTSAPTKRPPWTPAEDAQLLRAMASRCDIKEYGMKVSSDFAVGCRAFCVPTPGKREYEEILERCRVLRWESHKYDVVVGQRKGWGKAIWDDQSVAPPAPWYGPARSESESEDENEMDDDEVAERDKGKGKEKQRSGKSKDSQKDDEVVEEEAGERVEEEEGGHGQVQAEHATQSICDGGAQVSQQQPQEQHYPQSTAQGAAQTSQQDRSETPRGTKRDATFLIEAGGKRMRIGMPPKGTEIIFDPKDETVRIKF